MLLYRLRQISIPALLLVLILSAIPVKANSVNIAGDYLDYRMDGEEVVARGNAIVYQGNLRITADIIHADLSKDDVFAFGNVVLWQDRQKTTADAMTYNMQTGIGVMQGARLEQKSSYISAETLHISPRKMRGVGITWTTCEDEEDPHYKTTAREIVIVPGRSFEMHDMRIFLGKKQVYYSKKQSSVQGDENKLPFTLKYGYTKTDGVTVSIKSDIDAPMGVTGNYGLDWRQKTGDTVKTYLERTLPYGKASIGFNGNNNVDGVIRRDITGALSLTPEKINDWLTGSLNVDYLGRWGHSGQATSDQDLSLKMALNNSPAEEKYSVSLAVDRRFDLSATRGNTSLLEKSPELEIRHEALKVGTKLGELSFTPKLLSGHYLEHSATGLNSGQRHHFELGTNWPMLTIGMLEFNLSTDGAWTYYSSGDKRSVYFTRGRFQFKPIKSINSSISAEERLVFGSSPFNFDPQQKSKSVSVSHTWTPYTWMTVKPLSYSIDLDKHIAAQLMSDISINREGEMNKWTLYLKAAYENTPAKGIKKLLPSLKPTTYYMRWDLKPKRNIWSFNLASNYNNTEKTWVDHNITAKYRLGRRLTVGSTLRYDVKGGRLSTNSHDFTYDMHCWEIQANWNATRKEFWIQSFLKAYPDKAQKLIYDIEKKKVKPVIPQLDFMN